MVGIAVAAVLVFNVGRGVQWGRNRLVRRWGGRTTSGRSRRKDVEGGGEALDEWETVEAGEEQPTRRIVLRTSHEVEQGELSLEKAGSATSDGVEEKGRGAVSEMNAV